MNINNSSINNEAYFTVFTRETSEDHLLGTQTKVQEFVKIHFSDGREENLCFESFLLVNHKGVAIDKMGASEQRNEKINDLIKNGFTQVSVREYRIREIQDKK